MCTSREKLTTRNILLIAFENNAVIKHISRQRARFIALTRTWWPPVKTLFIYIRICIHVTLLNEQFRANSTCERDREGLNVCVFARIMYVWACAAWKRNRRIEKEWERRIVKRKSMSGRGRKSEREWHTELNGFELAHKFAYACPSLQGWGGVGRVTKAPEFSGQNK